MQPIGSKMIMRANGFNDLHDNVCRRLKLRYTHPDQPRAYKIPGGNKVCGL